jgi:iron complex transport system permease protein
MCGAALGIAGVVSQGLFRNPLASPTILGTTSGGTLAAVVSFSIGAATVHWAVAPIVSIFGCAVVTSLVFFIARRNVSLSMTNLLLVGFTINAFLGALTSLILSLDLEDIQKTSAILRWMFGSFSARSWEHVGLGAGPIVVGVIWAFSVAARLDVLILGEEVADTLGVNVRRLRGEAVLLISMLVGTTVAIAGGLPFIGLVVPHVTRAILGPHNKRLTLYSGINGMTLTLVSDLIARTVHAPLEIDVGVLTSLMGAPFFAYLLIRGGAR